MTIRAAGNSSQSWVEAALQTLERRDLLRRESVFSTLPEPEATVENRRVLTFCSNNYLGLAGDPQVRQAAADAALRWGCGSGASRLISGTMVLHRRLEAELAAFKGCEDAVLCSSGYLANIAGICSVAEKGDAVFSDRLNHASIIDACRLSQARVLVFGHRDLDHLEQLLTECRARRRLVVTDSVFSMDGDLADLPALADLCAKHEAMLMVDEAHATGLLGPHGGGALEAAGLSGKADLVMGTLSKALGSSGGFLAGKRPLMQWVRNRARAYIFDTAPNPASVGGALAALDLARSQPHRRKAALANAGRLAAGLSGLGFPVREPAAAIVPLVLGEPVVAVQFAKSLLEKGVFVPAIRPPSVPEGAARLRITTMSTHTETHLDTLLHHFGQMQSRRLPEPGFGDGDLSAPALRLSELKPGSSRSVRPETDSLGSVRDKKAPDALDGRLSAAKGAFISGTDTGVGKTFILACLALHFSQYGLRIAAMKPVQTGTSAGDDDLGFVRSKAGISAAMTECPYSFPQPLAPAVAARLSGLEVQVSPIRRSLDRLRTVADLVLVEGAGGLMAPLTEDMTMADLAVALQLPLIVVARAGLGTLNHTALSVELARARGLEVLGIIVNGFPEEPDIAERTNPEELERLTAMPLLGVVPAIGSRKTSASQHPFPARHEVPDYFSQMLGGRFDSRTFFRRLAAGMPRRGTWDAPGAGYDPIEKALSPPPEPV